MTSQRRSSDRPGAPPRIVNASTEESPPKRSIDSGDAPEGLPGDDESNDLPFAFKEGYWYGRGDDDRLVSDISERYLGASSDDVRDDQPVVEIATNEVKITNTPLSRSGRAIFSHVARKTPGKTERHVVAIMLELRRARRLRP